jgi:hypothetical protein
MANRSAAGSRLIDRRTVLQVAAALAAAGPALMREGHAAARPPVVIDGRGRYSPSRPGTELSRSPRQRRAHRNAQSVSRLGAEARRHLEIAPLPACFSS